VFQQHDHEWHCLDWSLAGQVLPRVILWMMGKDLECSSSVIFGELIWICDLYVFGWSSQSTPALFDHFQDDSLNSAMISSSTYKGRIDW
jgi:hypothetical protein